MAKRASRGTEHGRVLVVLSDGLDREDGCACLGGERWRQEGSVIQSLRAFSCDATGLTVRQRGSLDSELISQPARERPSCLQVILLNITHSSVSPVAERQRTYPHVAGCELAHSPSPLMSPPLKQR